MAINGKQYDHEDCQIMLPSGVAFGIQEINYEDKQDIEARYGKGAVPRGWGRKNYEASGSMTLDRDQFEEFKKELANTSQGGGLYDHAPFNIVCSYANDYQETITDTLPDVKVSAISTGDKQGEANTSQMKLTLVILSPIKWNGVAAKKG